MRKGREGVWGEGVQGGSTLRKPRPKTTEIYDQKPPSEKQNEPKSSESKPRRKTQNAQAKNEKTGFGGGKGRRGRGLSV